MAVVRHGKEPAKLNEDVNEFVFAVNEFIWKGLYIHIYISVKFYSNIKNIKPVPTCWFSVYVYLHGFCDGTVVVYSINEMKIHRNCNLQ